MNRIFRNMLDTLLSTQSNKKLGDVATPPTTATFLFKDYKLHCHLSFTQCQFSLITMTCLPADFLEAKLGILMSIKCLQVQGCAVKCANSHAPIFGITAQEHQSKKKTSGTRSLLFQAIIPPLLFLMSRSRASFGNNWTLRSR